MLSSDKNVASIAELVEALKQYVGLQKEYLELWALPYSSTSPSRWSIGLLHSRGMAWPSSW